MSELFDNVRRVRRQRLAEEAAARATRASTDRDWAEIVRAATPERRRVLDMAQEAATQLQRHDALMEVNLTRPVFRTQKFTHEVWWDDNDTRSESYWGWPLYHSKEQPDFKMRNGLILLTDGRIASYRGHTAFFEGSHPDYHDTRLISIRNTSGSGDGKISFLTEQIESDLTITPENRKVMEPSDYINHELFTQQFIAQVLDRHNITTPR